MSIDVVEYRELIVDGHYKDYMFKDYVSTWIARHMPHFPMGLISLSMERYTFVPAKVHSVRPVLVNQYVCRECGSHIYTDSEVTPKACCQTDEGVPGEFAKDALDCWAIRNDELMDMVNECMEYVEGERSYCVDFTASLVKVRFHAIYAWCWFDKRDAEAAASRMDQSYDNERQRESYPWYRNFVYYPDSIIDDDMLVECGFRVARYLGGEGDFRNDEEFRICGIDNGNDIASMESYLVARFHEMTGRHVMTSVGLVKITTDYRSIMDKIADEAGS